MVPRSCRANVGERCSYAIHATFVKVRNSKKNVQWADISSKHMSLITTVLLEGPSNLVVEIIL